MSVSVKKAGIEHVFVKHAHAKSHDPTQIFNYLHTPSATTVSFVYLYVGFVCLSRFYFQYHPFDQRRRVQLMRYAYRPEAMALSWALHSRVTNHHPKHIGTAASVSR